MVATSSDMVGKTVLVTGATAGIGKHTARALAMRGASVIITGRDVVRGQACVAELGAACGHDRVHLCCADMSQLAGVRDLAAQVRSRCSSLDVLINNAGLSRGMDKQYEAPLQDWEEMIDTNVKGLLYMSRAVVPGMVARGQGHVVNVGSIAGRQTYPGGSVYCATKAAVKALSEGLKLDLLGTPVRVTNIEPGFVETEFSDVRFHGDTERAKQVYKGMVPLTGEDIADSIVFAITRPPHINISEIFLMPTDQSSVFHVHRRPE